jgi:hypothetical protein
MKKRKPFKLFFKFEYQRFKTIRNIVFFILFAIVSICFIQLGANSYREELESRPVKDKVSQKEFLPAISVLFHNSIKDAKILVTKGLNPTDFFGLLYLVGSLVILSYGFETFRDISFMRMLLGQLGRRKLFMYSLFSRYFWISLVFLPFILLAAFLIMVNGIQFSGPDLVKSGRFILLWFVFSSVFFVSGALMGMLPSNVAGKSGKATLILSWISFIYLYPFALDNIVINPKSLNFAVGLMTILCLFGLIYCFSYIIFVARLFATKMDAHSIQQFTNTTISIHPGRLNVFQIGNRDTADLFFSLLNQKPKELSIKGMKSNFTIDGSPFSWKCDTNSKTGMMNLQYFPPPGSLTCDASTEIILKFLLDLLGQSEETLEALLNMNSIVYLKSVPVSELREVEQGLLLLKIAPFFNSNYYLFDNTATGMDSQFTLKFKQLMDRLAGNGSTNIYVTSNSSISLQGDSIHISKDDYWGLEVENYKQLTFSP